MALLVVPADFFSLKLVFGIFGYGVLNLNNNALDADPGYLRLHNKTMKDNWYQYIKSTCMRVGMLNNNLRLIRIRRKLTLTPLNS